MLKYDLNLELLPGGFIFKFHINKIKQIKYRRVYITMNNTTYSAKKGEVESKWYIIDAANNHLVELQQKLLNY